MSIQHIICITFFLCSFSSSISAQEFEAFAPIDNVWISKWTPERTVNRSLISDCSYLCMHNGTNCTAFAVQNENSCQMGKLNKLVFAAFGTPPGQLLSVLGKVNQSDARPTNCATDTFNKSNGSCACGFFLDTSLSFTQASASCKSYGARLPEISSREENDGLLAAMMNSPMKITDGILLGATDQVTEGKFVWDSSKTNLTFADWRAGDPSDAGAHVANCIQINFGFLKWNDVSCTAANQTKMCEMLFPC